MSEKKDIHVIIPAAGKPTNKIISNTTLPDTMLPINGKPVIGYILENLIERGICDVTIILNQSDLHTEYYVSKKFSTKLNLHIERNTSYERGVGYSIAHALKNISTNTGVMIYLGDTIYKGKLDFLSSFLVTTKEYETSDKWCFVEEENGILTYINKPNVYTGTGSVLAGLYYFENQRSFTDALINLVVEKDKIELHDILQTYNHSFTLVPASDYYDCGNIENYYKAKIDFLKTRSFNTVIYNDLYGTITKTGSNKQKLLDEINWYKNIPNDLKIFSPRLLDYNFIANEVSYKIEYYGYQSLADYFVFNHLDKQIWTLVIKKIFDVLHTYKQHNANVPFAHYEEMYKNKTLQRVSELRSNPTWENCFSQTKITINHKVYGGWPYFESKLNEITSYLYEHSHGSFIHGDACLSNILFDPHNRLIKLIDPRGNFGETSVYGDHNYDLAKLRHSFVGKYDFIVSDLFDTQERDAAYSLSVYNESYHEEVALLFDKELVQRGYNLKAITLIEGLLFISMIPLHKDSFSRQTAMFLTGIKKLNSVTI